MNPHRVSKSAAQAKAKADVIVATGVSRFPNLPTLAEMNAKPRAIPKVAGTEVVGTSKVSARLRRAKDKQKNGGADRKKLYQWAQAVKKRDQWFDRYDGRPVLKAAEMHPRRAEAHHVVSRSDKAVRYDIRNGITLSLETHALVEDGKLEIIGTKFFTVGGTRYIDATFDVKFKEKNQ